MRNSSIIFILLFSLSGFSQNWNVFNKNYRYNYKFNNSKLISNVVFANMVTYSGTDTIYSMNRIGVVTGNSITPNQPQFLMNKIIKLANGNVQLQDTANITIIPTCTLNQSWLFDATYNLTATCVAASAATLFSIIDSVKTIIVNNVDTIKLSKQFGIIQFPKLYAQNKYYRLVGIEKAKKYDSIPMFGQKVPNAWDFYNFNAGDKRLFSYNYVYGSPPSFTGCKLASQIFKTKTISSNGYSYNLDEVAKTYFGNGWEQGKCFAPEPYCPPTYTANLFLNYSDLTTDTTIANLMYPGMVFNPTNVNYLGIASFGLDNNGIFYKYYGGSCQPSNTLTILPNAGVHASGLIFGVGLGCIYDEPEIFEGASTHCISSFEKGNIIYFNPYTTVGIKENVIIQNGGLIYPNPANNRLNFNLENLSKLRIYNSLGKLILDDSADNKFSLDISKFPNGIYFIELENDSFKTHQKIIIEH